MTTFWNRGVDTDRRTGSMLADGPWPAGSPVAYSAWWDSDDNYPGYGFGRTMREAAEALQELTDEWILAGKPEV